MRGLKVAEKYFEFLHILAILPESVHTKIKK